jgi:hypothetical protein
MEKEKLVLLSPGQRNALKDLSRGPADFGAGFLWSVRTGRSLINRGLATEIRRLRKQFLKAKITEAGLDALDRGGRVPQEVKDDV